MLTEQDKGLGPSSIKLVKGWLTEYAMYLALNKVECTVIIYVVPSLTPSE